MAKTTVFRLDSTIVDKTELHCTLSSTSKSPLTDPLICFSLMAPPRVLEGGEKIEGLGGFAVIRLFGALSNEAPLKFKLSFEDPEIVFANRAWHPQGPYLRLESGEFAHVESMIVKGCKTSASAPRKLPLNGLALVPPPKSWQAAAGRLDVTGISVPPIAQGILDHVNALCERSGLPPLNDGARACDIILDPGLGGDAYELKIGETLSLKAGGDAGIFYGLITLLNLRETHQGALPKGLIKDAPRFGWRGFMLDCARAFYPVEAILKLLDLMALLKLNRFHWHFCDDEAFRIELNSLPELWQKTKYRGEGELLPGLFGGGFEPNGGSYSTEDVMRIVAHAKSLNIEVLPEIELPAHALSLAKIYPETRDPKDRGQETSVQGYQNNVLNPACPETWDLVEKIITEVSSLFPFRHLHLGGDELPEGTWDGSPMMQAFKEEHGLITKEDVEGHFMARAAGLTVKNKSKACAWQEASLGHQGGIGHDAILFAWKGVEGGIEAAKRGYKVVMCPAQHTYFDMAHTDDPDDWGANWAANYGLSETINWDPIPEELKGMENQILGVEGTFWSEFTSDPRQFEPMIAPRILGLATMGWSAQRTTQQDLHDLATCYLPFFDAINWKAHAKALDR